MHAEIARDMVLRHDWRTAYANGVPVRSSSRLRSSKLLDWSIALSFRLFGVADWSARLPIALAVLALAASVFFFGRTLFAFNAAGLYAALIVLTWPGTFVATRDLTSGPLLCLGTTLMAYVLWHLLLVRKVAVWIGLLMLALACAFFLLFASWPEVLLPLAVLWLCWGVRRVPDPVTRTRLFLTLWVSFAVLLAAIQALGQISGAMHFGRPDDALAWFAAVPPLALLFGGWLAHNEAFSSPEKGRGAAWSIFAVGLLLGAAALFFALSPGFCLAWQYGSTAVVAGRAGLLAAAAALIAGVTGHLLFRLRNRVRIANCFLAGTLAGLTIAVLVTMVMASPRFSSQILADAIRPELGRSDLVVVNGNYPEASSFAFYLERPVALALPAGANAPVLPAGQSTEAVDLDQVWTGASRVYLWTWTNHPPTLPGQSYVIAASGGKEVLSNQRNSGGAAF